MVVSRRAVEVYGVVVMFAYTLTLAAIWFTAFFSDGGVVVTINDYGEQWVELGLWFISLPILAAATYLVVRRHHASETDE